MHPVEEDGKHSTFVIFYVRFIVLFYFKLSKLRKKKRPWNKFVVLEAITFIMYGVFPHVTDQINILLKT
jgi:uncharacterized protein (DUF983 family)